MLVIAMLLLRSYNSCIDKHISRWKSNGHVSITAWACIDNSFLMKVLCLDHLQYNLQILGVVSCGCDSVFYDVYSEREKMRNLR